MRNGLLAGAAAFALCIIPSMALADVHSEIVIAGQHAGLAAGAADIATVHAHLHHALNCLVGSGGKGFDASQLNPCANSGKGAIPDSTDAKKKASLEAAAAKARDGIASNDASAAKKAASEVADMLKKAE